MPQQNYYYDNITFPNGSKGSIQLSPNGITFRPEGEKARECRWKNDVVDYNMWSTSSQEHNLQLLLHKISKKKGTEKTKAVILTISNRDDLVQIEKDISGFMWHNNTHNNTTRDKNNNNNSNDNDMDIDGSMSSLSRRIPTDSNRSNFTFAPFNDSFSSANSATNRHNSTGGTSMSESFWSHDENAEGEYQNVVFHSMNTSGSLQSQDAYVEEEYQNVVFQGKTGTLVTTKDGLTFYEKMNGNGGKQRKIGWKEIQRQQRKTLTPKLRLHLHKGKKEEAVIFTFVTRAEMDKLKTEIDSQLNAIMLENRKMGLSPKLPQNETAKQNQNQCLNGNDDIDEDELLREALRISQEEEAAARSQAVDDYEEDEDEIALALRLSQEQAEADQRKLFQLQETSGRLLEEEQLRLAMEQSMNEEPSVEEGTPSADDDDTAEQLRQVLEESLQSPPWIEQNMSSAYNDDDDMQLPPRLSQQPSPLLLLDVKQHPEMWSISDEQLMKVDEDAKRVFGDRRLFQLQETSGELSEEEQLQLAMEQSMNEEPSVEKGKPSADDDDTAEQLRQALEESLQSPSIEQNMASAHNDDDMQLVPRLSRQPSPLYLLDVKQHPEMWSISYEQLMKVDEDAKMVFGDLAYEQATMRDINCKILIPNCQKTGKSYALSLNPQGLMVDAFITHAWDEPFAAFVESIRSCFHTTFIRPNLWICAFALLQGDPQLIEEQIGIVLDESPFVKALSKAQKFVVVRNSAVDLYSRIWCICELMYATKLGLVPKKCHVTGPDNFSTATTSCLDAQASNPKDRYKIMEILIKEYSMAEIDDIVHRFRSYEPPRFAVR